MGQTDGRTPDRYITLTVRRGQRNNLWYHFGTELIIKPASHVKFKLEKVVALKGSDLTVAVLSDCINRRTVPECPVYGSISPVR